MILVFKCCESMPLFDILVKKEGIVIDNGNTSSKQKRTFQTSPFQCYIPIIKDKYPRFCYTNWIGNDLNDIDRWIPVGRVLCFYQCSIWTVCGVRQRAGVAVIFILAVMTSYIQYIINAYSTYEWQLFHKLNNNNNTGITVSTCRIWWNY